MPRVVSLGKAMNANRVVVYLHAPAPSTASPGDATSSRDVDVVYGLLPGPAAVAAARARPHK